jgi:hypothetical protein
MNNNESLDPEDIETSEETSEETINDEEAHSVPLEQYEELQPILRILKKELKKKRV